jgi:hypothetical protein
LPASRPIHFRSLPLSEPSVLGDVTRPILRNNPGANIAVKRRVRPIPDAADQPMLDRIDVATFDMTGVIRLVTDQMFPEPALPDAAFVSLDPDMAEPFPFRKRLHKAALDQSPACREIGIARRQSPDCMEMVRQDHKGVDGEGAECVA